MDGAEIKAARQRRRLTQAQLAELVGASARSVGNWERGDTVPKNRMAALEALFQNGEDNDDPIRAASDQTLLAELLRRSAQRGA